MNKGDVLIMFDIRRYEQEMVSACRAPPANAASKSSSSPTSGVRRSPSSPRHAFRIRIEAPSAWDSSVVTLFIVEALIEAVQSSTWDETHERMKTLEGLFESDQAFPKAGLGGQD